MIQYVKDNAGVILIFALALLPLALWALMRPLAGRFASPVSVYRSLGQLAGLLGMALLSMNFVLAARYRFLDRLFNGLNKVYDKHHLVGALAFSLILFHPTFLTVQYLFISLSSAYFFLFSFQDTAVTLGEVALFTFMVLMVVTFYLHFKYQNWKNTHKFLGVVLFLGALHMILVPSDISNNAVLKYYMLGLAALGAFSYIYRTIVGVYTTTEYRHAVEKGTKVTDMVVELVLTPLSKKIIYQPGQFIFLRFEQDGVLSESHPFSITSFSGSDHLSLGIKTLGDYTSMVYLLKPGVVCRIEGPFGVFSYTKVESKKQIWGAGGIGITPFLGMARQLGRSGDLHEVDLYYSVGNEKKAAFASELTDIARRTPHFKFHPHYSETEGYLSPRLIIEGRKDLGGTDVFLCGPLTFMQSLRSQFIAVGFDNKRIHSEEFNLAV